MKPSSQNADPARKNPKASTAAHAPRLWKRSARSTRTFQSRGGAPGSVAWLITGSVVPARTLRTAANGMPAGVVPIVVRAAVGAVPARSRLGDADVVTVGAIEDLARGIRQTRST